MSREHVLRILKAWAFGRNTGRLRLGGVIGEGKKYGGRGKGLKARVGELI